MLMNDDIKKKLFKNDFPSLKGNKCIMYIIEF